MFSLKETLNELLTTYGVLSLRYIFFAGILYLVFYAWKHSDIVKLKIQQKFPSNKDVLREMGYSFLSLSVFAIVTVVLYYFQKGGYTKIYTNYSDHSTAYFIFSVVAFVALHDTYFYWTHRLMHWKKIYRYVHKVHHESTNPTPWAAFAFHPIEAFVEVGIILVVPFIMPVHPLCILIWVVYMTFINVGGHLGFEIFRQGFVSGAVSKWHNTSTHHNMHHKYVTANYGLYFNFWDRIMGTNHAKYEQEFNSVARKARWMIRQEADANTINRPIDTTKESATANS